MEVKIITPTPTYDLIGLTQVQVHVLRTFLGRCSAADHHTAALARQLRDIPGMAVRIPSTLDDRPAIVFSYDKVSHA